MVGFRRVLLCASLTFMLGASRVHAYGDYVAMWSTPGLVVSYSYYPGVVYNGMWAAPAYCWPTTLVARTIYAAPTPAPPSQPPTNKKQAAADPKNPQRPVIITTRASAGDTNSVKELCRVGFWNMSGREVTLTIESKTWTLAKDRMITLDLPRDFSWQIDQQSPQAERIPNGQVTHEVVVR